MKCQALKMGKDSPATHIAMVTLSCCGCGETCWFQLVVISRPTKLLNHSWGREGASTLLAVGQCHAVRSVSAGFNLLGQLFRFTQITNHVLPLVRPNGQGWLGCTDATYQVLDNSTRKTGRCFKKITLWRKLEPCADFAIGVSASQEAVRAEGALG